MQGTKAKTTLFKVFPALNDKAWLIIHLFLAPKALIPFVQLGARKKCDGLPGSDAETVIIASGGRNSVLLFGKRQQREEQTLIMTVCKSNFYLPDTLKKLTKIIATTSFGLFL